MRRLAALLICLAVLASGPGATRADELGFASQTDLMRWMMGYRKSPEPKRLAAAVHAMSELGLLEDQDAAGVYVGFVAGVLGANQLDAKTLIDPMFPMRSDEQVTVVRAVAYSGLPEWHELLRALAVGIPERKVLIDRFLAGEAGRLMELPLEHPRTLDTLWGYYISTGSYEPIMRVIAALAWTREGDDLDRLTAGSMAKWTLASNAAKDQSLLKLCYVEAEHQPEAVAATLKEVIEAAETYELGPIRKEALKAIEELRTKGPESSRSRSWAMQAGSTVLALGCVAAGATGHAEIAAPCVIAGALGTAAQKLLTSE